MSARQRVLELKKKKFTFLAALFYTRHLRNTSSLLADGLDLDELSLDPTESSEVLSDWSGSSGWPAYDVGEDAADFGGHRSRERSRRGASVAAADILESSSSKSW